MTIRTFYRRFVPPGVRARVRLMRSEAAIRLRDLPADVLDLFSREPLPPARLRLHVGTDSSRKQFTGVGLLVARELLRAFRDTARSDQPPGVWLDFGCGSGRVARHVIESGVARELVGVDVDERCIRWCSRHSSGRWIAIAPADPFPLPDGSVDVVYSISVFTHIDEAAQDFWLQEIARVLRPGGVLIVSTHPPSVAYNRPDLTADDHAVLQQRGFLFAKGALGSFNDDSAFHSPAYLGGHWSHYLDRLAYFPGALANVQDLSVWRKR